MEQNREFIKKAKVSKSEFIAQIIEAGIGLALAIVGAIILFTSGGLEAIFLEGDVSIPSIVLLLIGALLLINGVSGLLPYGIGMLMDQDEFIAFDNEVIYIHSANPNKCKTIPLNTVSAVGNAEIGTFDFMGRIVSAVANCGEIMITYHAANGDVDVEIFGPIDKFDDFMRARDLHCKQIVAQQG